MRKVWQYVIGTIVGGIIGVIAYYILLFDLQEAYPSNCSMGNEMMQLLPGAGCIHYYFGFLSVIICLPVSLVISLIGCRLVDTLYKSDSKYMIAVGGIIAGLFIPFVYMFLGLLASFMR